MCVAKEYELKNPYEACCIDKLKNSYERLHNADSKDISDEEREVVEKESWIYANFLKKSDPQRHILDNRNLLILLAFYLDVDKKVGEGDLMYRSKLDFANQVLREHNMPQIYIRNYAEMAAYVCLAENADLETYLKCKTEYKKQIREKQQFSRRLLLENGISSCKLQWAIEQYNPDVFNDNLDTTKVLTNMVKKSFDMNKNLWNELSPVEKYNNLLHEESINKEANIYNLEMIRAGATYCLQKYVYKIIEAIQLELLLYCDEDNRRKKEDWFDSEYCIFMGKTKAGLNKTEKPRERDISELRKNAMTFKMSKDTYDFSETKVNMKRLYSQIIYNAAGYNTLRGEVNPDLEDQLSQLVNWRINWGVNWFQNMLCGKADVTREWLCITYVCMISLKSDSRVNIEDLNRVLNKCGFIEIDEQKPRDLVDEFVLCRKQNKKYDQIINLLDKPIYYNLKTTLAKSFEKAGPKRTVK